MDLSAKNDDPKNRKARKSPIGFALLLCLVSSVQLASASCAKPASIPRNVHLESVNFFTTMNWEPGSGAPADQLYSVYYHGSYEKQHNVSMLVMKNCNCTPETSCNLTGALSVWSIYTIVVCAVDETINCCGPAKDIRVIEYTMMDAPSIDHLDVVRNGIKVSLSPPMLSEDGTDAVEFQTYNATACARIDGHSQCRHKYSSTNTLDFEDLEYNTEYCFIAQVHMTYDEQDEISEVSEEKCQKTAKRRVSNGETLAAFFVSLAVGFVIVFPLLLMARKIFRVARYVFVVDMPLPKSLCELATKQNGSFPLIAENQAVKDVNISTVEVMCGDVEDDYINGLGLQ